MFDPRDISADLPAPRDDEPESLRSDIVDELADHLGCAFQRELHRTHDEQRAKQSVLARFGDPAAVARKLWWDAMKERIMSQKITAAAVTVIALVAIGLFAVTWQTLAGMRTFMQETQELNATLIGRLEGLEKPAPAANYDWCRFTVRLVENDADGGPVVGAATTLQKLSTHAGGTETDRGKTYPFTTMESNEEGVVDFSPVPYGPYYFTVQTEDGHFLKKEIAVRPGQDYETTIVCPTSLPTGDVVLDVSMYQGQLTDNAHSRVWTLCRVYQPNFFTWGHAAGTAIDGTTGGTEIEGDRWLLWVSRTVLVGPEGEMLEVEWPSETVDASTPDGMSGFGGSWPQPQLVERFSLTDEPRRIDHLTLPVGEYAVDTELVILESGPDEGAEMTWRLLNDEEREPFEQEPAEGGFFGDVSFGPVYEVVASEVNVWTVPVSSPNAVDRVLATVEKPQPINVTGWGDGGAVGGLGGGFGGGFGGGGFGGGGFF